MITQPSPVVRRQLVAARITGMMHGAEHALRAISAIRDRTTGLTNRVAIGLLESEIHALDLRPKEALTAFATHVEPLLSELDHRTAAVVADNKTLILMDSLDTSATDHFYHLIDVRRILGIELRDHSSILEAADEAAAGNHFDALPVYWQQLRAAYNLQNWRARRMAERDFAQECIQLNSLDEAAYHAMVSESKDTVEKVAASLMAARSSEQIDKVLDKLLAVSSLKKHAVQLARIVRKIADAVPDDRLTRIAEFLLLHADSVPTGWHDAALFEEIWRAIEELAIRFDACTINLFAARGIAHPVLQNGGPLRRHVIRALDALTAAIAPEQLSSIADVAMGLIGEKRSDIDYIESLNLLCHIALRSDDGLKTRIRSTIFPAGAQISDALLMQVGPHLGWTPQKPEGFSEGARKTAEAVRKQVQRLALDEEPAKIGASMIQTSKSANGQVVVNIHGATHWVEALAAHRHLIEGPALRELLEAMLDMIAEQDNAIANRTALTSLLGQFADRFPCELEHRLANVLEPLANGHIVESTLGQTHADATNPLNPFKMGFGNPKDLRGAALLCLAEQDRERTDISTEYRERIRPAAITSADPEVRRYGLAAAERGNDLTPTEETAVALAGLDPDPRVARLALRALGKSRPRVTLEPLTWHIVIRCIEAAIVSADVGYRCAAAEMLKLMANPPAELTLRIEATRAALQGDICHSVRRRLN